MSELRETPYAAEHRGMANKTRIKVQLVIEEDAMPMTRLASDLTQWFSPEYAQMDLTHAVKPISDTSWFFHEARRYVETVVERQRVVRDSSRKLVQTLQKAGFILQQDGLSVISDEGANRLLDELRVDPKDLLVIVSGWPPSHFSMALARKASCSVLLLRTLLKSRVGRLVTLFSTDGSQAADIALQKLPSLLPAEYLSVSIVTVQTPCYTEHAALAPFVNIPSMEEVMEENSIRILDLSRVILESRGIQVLDGIRLVGEPVTELLRLAGEKIDPDLIVVGAHNRNAFSNWLLGSVSQRFLHDAPYNLLIVR